MHCRDLTQGTSLAEALRRILAVAANPATSGRALADEVLRFAAARLVVLVQTDADSRAVAVAPDSRRVLLEHPALAVLLREADELEIPRFYSSDTVVPGLAAIQSGGNQTNCLALPLI